MAEGSDGAINLFIVLHRRRTGMARPMQTAMYVLALLFLTTLASGCGLLRTSEADAFAVAEHGLPAVVAAIEAEVGPDFTVDAEVTSVSLQDFGLPVREPDIIATYEVGVAPKAEPDSGMSLILEIVVRSDSGALYSGYDSAENLSQTMSFLTSIRDLSPQRSGPLVARIGERIGPVARDSYLYVGALDELASSEASSDPLVDDLIQTAESEGWSAADCALLTWSSKDGDHGELLGFSETQSTWTTIANILDPSSESPTIQVE